MGFQAVQDARSAVDDRQNKCDQDNKMSGIQLDKWVQGSKRALVRVSALWCFHRRNTLKEPISLLLSKR